jgi:hypothetical protein
MKLIICLFPELSIPFLVILLPEMHSAFTKRNTEHKVDKLWSFIQQKFREHQNQQSHIQINFTSMRYKKQEPNSNDYIP